MKNRRWLRREARTKLFGVALVVLALAPAGCSPDRDPEAEARMELGHRVFTELAQPTCATCHTLQHAGATGKIGPNLDQLKADSQRVVAAVTNGVGIMPPQSDKLTEEQIRTVAHYVVQVAGAPDATGR